VSEVAAAVRATHRPPEVNAQVAVLVERTLPDANRWIFVPGVVLPLDTVRR
jgi:hypothetical protein